MGKWIKKAGIILILLVFFINTTGFTLYIHICSCLNTTKHQVFNELIKSKPVCCCEREIHTKTSDDCSDENYTNSECCHNDHFLIKSFSYLPPLVVKVSDDKVNKSLFYPIIKRINFSIENKPLFEKLVSQYHPPPLLAGKQLIISYNQFKIPLSV